MRYLSLHPCFFLFTLLVLAPTVAFCAEEGGETVTLEADTLSHEGQSDTVEATGNVRVRGRGLTLLADRVTYYKAKDEAEALGRVTLLRNGDTLRGDRVKIDLANETGEVENGNLHMKKGNFYLYASRMYKLGKEDYRIERGTFTTCDGDSPSWRFTARDINVTVGEYATGKHALFYLKDVPVLYFPYVIFPVKNERQSGFLTPRTGNSSKKGFTLEVAYYWVISPSQDATINLDLQSKRGVATGLDYRYIRARGSEGSFRGYAIYDSDQKRFRGDLTQKHQELFSDTLNLKSDINLVSDRDFYRDFAEDTGTYNRSSLESSVSLTKYFRRYVLAAETRYAENLNPNIPNNRQTLQKFPVVNLTGIKRRVGTLPLFLSLDSSFTNFYREEGINGQRLDIHPTATLYVKPSPLIETSVWAGFRQRLYTAYAGNTGNGYHGSGLFDGGGAISATLARVYDTGRPDMPQVRHVVVPEARYSFVQDKDQSTLPFFDFHDRVVAENMVTYSVTNYLTGKFPRGDGSFEYHDVGYLRISQGYKLSGSRRDLLTLVPETEDRSFSTVRIEALARPVKQFSLWLDTRYDTYRTDFTSAAVSGELSDARGNLAGLGYRFAGQQVEYLEGKLGIALVKPFVFNYTGRYSFDRGDFLESYYSLEYRHQCWTLSFTYRDRLDNREFYVNFALAGVGSLGKVRAL